MRKVFFIVLFLSCGLYTRGQDAIFTLIDHNPLSINPAFTNGNGEIQFLTLSRQQWWNLPGASALSAAYHMNQASLLYPVINKKYNGLSLGIQLNRNESGEGKFGMTDVNFFSAVRKDIHVRYKPAYKVEVGIGLGLKQYNIDWSQLTFSSQLDPFFGLVNTFPNINPRVSSSNAAVSGSFGISITQNSKWRNRKLSTKFGGALYHFNKPGISFFDQTERINPRYSGHISTILFPNNRSGIVGSVTSTYYILRHNIHHQYPLTTNETRIGTNINGLLTIYTGFRRRKFLIENQSSDALIWSIQLNAPGFMLSVGYDFTISDLNIQRTSGTTEIGITIPLGVKSKILGRRATEPCYVDYILSQTEWKAVEQFNKSSTNWGRSYAPSTYIR